MKRQVVRTRAKWLGSALIAKQKGSDLQAAGAVTTLVACERVASLQGRPSLEMEFRLWLASASDQHQTAEGEQGEDGGFGD